MGSKTSSQQNQQSYTQADPQAYADYNKAISRAQTVSRTPYTAYSGELTAPVNAQENLATTAMNGLGGVADHYFSQAANQSALGAAAINPSAVDAAAIRQYESPYQSDVIDTTRALMNQQDAIQQQQLTGSAIGAGAFGGDRAGVAQAALAGQQALANNSTLAGLANQNYAQALQEANTQQQVGLGAAWANRAALQQNAETLAGIGSAATSAGLGVANAQLGAGALQQQTQQAGDTANYGQFLQQQAYPFQTSQFLTNTIEGIAPNYRSSTAGTTTTQTSPWNSIIGGGIALGGLLSDRRAKEDIRKVGATFDKQPIYAFRYKGSPVTELGLVAQEVEKKHPGAVAPGLGGLKHVDYAEATRAAASKGHFASGGGVGAAAFHQLHPDEVAHLERAAGGSAIDSTPYSDVTGYVPTTGLGAVAHMLQSQPAQSATASTSSPTGLVPNFSQFATAGQNLGNATGLSGSLGSLGNFFGGGMNSVGTFNFARGGGVDERGLGGAWAFYRPRRGYDGGGVVGPEGLVFDPDALGSSGAVQPGLGNAVLPPGLTPPAPGLAPSTPPQSQGLGDVKFTPTPVGLGAGFHDNAPVPVAPAPVMTPVTGYRQGDGSVVPAPGLGGARMPPTGQGAAEPPPTGLGAIAAVSPQSTDPLGGYTARVRTMESRGNDDAVSSAGATGRYQFMPQTWSDVSSKHPELGLTAAGINDPGQQDAAMRAFTADNAASLTRALGRPPTQSELYLAHQQGANGAIGLLTNPNARASDIVGEKAITGNGGTPNMTAGQFSGMWDARFNGTGGVSGGMPSSALGYTGGGGIAGGEPAPVGLGAVAKLPIGLDQADPARRGGLGALLGFGPGGDGGLFGLSDDARQSLISAGAAIMASPSKSPGIAIGEGVAKGLATNQSLQKLANERGLTQAQVANLGSEIQNRGAMQGIERDRVKIAGQELEATLANYANEAKYRDTEGKARLSDAATNAGRLNLERYQVVAGPDNDFRYFDKLNPGAGLLTPAQVAAASGGTAPAAAASQPAAPASPAAGGAGANAQVPSGSGPSPAGAATQAASASLDSSSFMRTGNPTLAVPHGYMPHGYYQTAMRAQNDPVMRETLAKQTEHDVTEANERAQKAYSSSFYSDEMDRNAASLPNSGLLVPGAAFPERLGLAKNWNAAVTALGMDNLQINPDAAKAGEGLVKDKVRLNSDLVISLGSREAASVFGTMLSAVPGADNTRAGYKAISSSIRVLSQRDIDRNAFFQDWVGRYGNTLGAESAFNQLNPAMQYARQAQALARVPQEAKDILRANANDPRAIVAFERTYGAGLSRFFTGQFAQ